MKYVLLLFALWVASASAQSVPDTTYYDITWSKCAHDTAAYYRTCTKEKDIYHVTDHYIDGGVQMEGTYTALHPDVKNGFVTYYYPSGYKASETEYYNNKKRGTLRRYEDSTGVMILSEEYKDDMKNGRTHIYLKNGDVVTRIYDSDKLIRTINTPHKKSDSETKKIGSMVPEPTSKNPNANALKEAIKKNVAAMPDSLRNVNAVIIVKFRSCLS